MENLKRKHIRNDPKQKPGKTAKANKVVPSKKAKNKSSLLRLFKEKIKKIDSEQSDSELSESTHMNLSLVLYA